MEKKIPSKVLKKNVPVQKPKVCRPKMVGVKSRVKTAPLKQKTAVTITKKQGKSRPAPIPEPGFAMYSTDSEEVFSFCNEKNTCAKVLTMLRRNHRVDTDNRKPLGSCTDQPRRPGAAKDTVRSKEDNTAYHPIVIPCATNDYTPGHVTAKSVLGNGNTPFNDRLASSTPDPDRPQIIPERDTNCTPRVPFGDYNTGATTVGTHMEYHGTDFQLFGNHGYQSVMPTSGTGQSFVITGIEQNMADGLGKRESDIGAFEAYIARESTGFSTVPTSGQSPERVGVPHGNNQSGSSGDKSRSSFLQSSQTTGNSSGTEYIYLPRPAGTSGILDRNVPPGFHYQNGLYQIRPHGPMTAGAPGEERQIHDAQLIPVSSTNSDQNCSDHRPHGNFIYEVPERDIEPKKSPRPGETCRDAAPDTISTIDGSVANTFEALTPRSTITESTNQFLPATEPNGFKSKDSKPSLTDNVKSKKQNSSSEFTENRTGSFQTQSSQISAESNAGSHGISSTGTLYHLIHTDKGKELVPVSLVPYPSFIQIPGGVQLDNKGQGHRTNSQGQVQSNIESCVPVSVLTNEADFASLKHQSLSSAVNSQDNQASVPGQPNPWSGVRLDAGMKRVRYLLGEMKECGKINKDVEIGRLTREIEKSLDSIPQLSATFSLQAEIDLALQPLRNENAQLRRKLRLANQNVREHEQEKLKATGVDFDVLHLKASNSGLQRQLKEEMEEKVKLAAEVATQLSEIQRMKVERNRLLAALSEKETDELKIKQECLIDAQKFRKEMEAMNRQIEAIQLQQEASDQENHILQVSLQQRDAEINRLQDTVQEMKSSVTELMQELDKSGDQNVMNDDSRRLLLKILGGEQQMSRPPASILSPSRSQNTQNIRGLAVSRPAGPVKTLRFDPRERESRAEYRSSAKLTEQALASHNKSLEQKSDNKGNNCDRKIKFMLNEGTQERILSRQRRRSSSPHGRRELKEGSHRRTLSSSPRQVERLSLIDSEVKDGDKSTEDIFTSQRMNKILYDDGHERHGSQQIINYNKDRSGIQPWCQVNFESNRSDAEQSRYSVTDYFRKYKTTGDESYKRHSIHQRAASQPADLLLGSTQTGYPRDFTTSRFTNSQQSESKRPTTLGIQPRSKSDSREKSGQDSLYHGTTLDNSVSAIEDDNISSVSGSGKTLSSSSTVTDKTFRKGIATLDANILKLQLALQRTKSMLS